MILPTYNWSQIIKDKMEIIQSTDEWRNHVNSHYSEGKYNPDNPYTESDIQWMRVNVVPILWKSIIEKVIDRHKIKVKLKVNDLKYVSGRISDPGGEFEAVVSTLSSPITLTKTIDVTYKSDPLIVVPLVSMDTELFNTLYSKYLETPTNELYEQLISLMESPYKSIMSEVINQGILENIEFNNSVDFTYNSEGTNHYENNYYLDLGNYLVSNISFKTPYISQLRNNFPPPKIQIDPDSVDFNATTNSMVKNLVNNTDVTFTFSGTIGIRWYGVYYWSDTYGSVRYPEDSTYTTDNFEVNIKITI